MVLHSSQHNGRLERILPSPYAAPQPDRQLHFSLQNLDRSCRRPVAGRALASMDAGSFDDTDGFVAGRSLDEWSEALFPGATMRTTQKFDPDSPYSRLIEARTVSLSAPSTCPSLMPGTAVGCCTALHHERPQEICLSGQGTRQGTKGLLMNATGCQRSGSAVGQ